jgi:hypothetical protein
MSILETKAIIDVINSRFDENRLMKFSLEIYRVIGDPSGNTPLYYNSLMINTKKQKLDINLFDLIKVEDDIKVRSYNDTVLVCRDIIDKLLSCQEFFSFFILFIDVKYDINKSYRESENISSHSNLVIFEKNRVGCDYTVKRFDPSCGSELQQNMMDQYVTNILLKNVDNMSRQLGKTIPRITFIPTISWSVQKMQGNLGQCFSYCHEAYNRLLRMGRGSINQEYFIQQSEIIKRSSIDAQKARAYADARLLLLLMSQ